MARKWRLTKTALRDLTRRLDAIKFTVEGAVHRAEQMDSMAAIASRDAPTAAAYERAGEAFRDVAKDTIARVDELSQERLAAQEAAEDAARLAYEARRADRERRRAARDRAGEGG